MRKGTNAVDIKAALAGRPTLRDRTRHTSDADAQAAFATLSPYRGGAVFAGSFSGESPWERHLNGDELVHILDGATTLTIIIDDEPQIFEMTGGMLVVVPQGCWHRFESTDGVTVLTMTPQPTEHTTEEDPRS
jgi:mannose-6-phosphate isomerase-like protein (cupin superfamily)